MTRSQYRFLQWVSAAFLIIEVLLPIIVLNAEELPTAEAVLDAFVEATGGAESYAKLENRTLSGTTEFVTQGIRIPFTIYQARPMSMYSVCAREALGSSF